MTAAAKFYIKYCPNSNIENLIEWWISGNNDLTTRLSSDDKQIYTYQYSTESHQALSYWIAQGFCMEFEEPKIDSTIEIYHLDDAGNIVDWRRLDSMNPVAQNILHSLPYPAPHPPIRNKSKKSMPKIFGIASLIFTYLFIWGAYAIEWLKREFQYDPYLVKYKNILSWLIIIVPILYLVFFCTKSKAKNTIGVVAASLAVIRQFFRLLEHPNLAACVYFSATLCFLLAVLFIVLGKKTNTVSVACCTAIIPVALTITGIIVSDWDGISLMLISTSIFIVSALFYLVQTTKSAE